MGYQVKRIIFVVLLHFLFASSASAALKLKDTAPTFSLMDSEGGDFYLSDVVGATKKKNGKGVILSFFASWCAPCRSELLLIDSLTDELNGKGIRVVIIGYKEGFERINELLTELKVTKPLVLSDLYGSVGAKYEVRFLPATYFIDSDGKVKDVIFGEINGEKELRDIAGKLLK
jgi:thiol-disulfide isomerase/thioredoxin